MKQIYIIVFFFISIHGYSQLYIKPDANQDSYVYVESTEIFVEKQIDIKLQESENQISGLFLRNEGQLLQGKSNIPNTGNGFLSVFQEGEATAYTYNYWSLPVSDVSSVKKIDNVLYDPLDKLRSKKIETTTALNGSSNPLKISNKWLYKFSGDNYYNWLYIGNNFDLLPGEGFSMKGVEGQNMSIVLYNIFNNPGSKQRYDFRGLPNNGSYALNIQKEMSLLVGNPYPSALDLNLFLTENTSITGIAYFWDSAPIASHNLRDYEGGYGAYSPALGDYGYVPPLFKRYNSYGDELTSTTKNGIYYGRRYAPIAQGFMIIGLLDGFVNFKNEYRSYIKENVLNSHFKNQKKEDEIGLEISFLRLNIDFDKEYSRQLLLSNNENSTIHADRAMDAENISKSKSDIGWLIDNKNFIINIQPIEANTKIPLQIILSENRTITFQVEKIHSFKLPIFLYDTFTEETHYLSDLNEFTFTLDEGVYNDRFYLTFLKEYTPNHEEEEEEEEEEDHDEIENEIPLTPIDNLQAYQDHDLQKIIVRLPKLLNASEIELFDDRGRKIFKLKAIKDEFLYELPTNNLSHGLYFIKIKSTKGNYISKKIIISK